MLGSAEGLTLVLLPCALVLAWPTHSRSRSHRCRMPPPSEGHHGELGVYPPGRRGDGGRGEGGGGEGGRERGKEEGGKEGGEGRICS